jgi:hypothetical protein
MYKALNSIPSTVRKEGRKEERKKETRLKCLSRTYQ